MFALFKCVKANTQNSRDQLEFGVLLAVTLWSCIRRNRFCGLVRQHAIGTHLKSNCRRKTFSVGTGLAIDNQTKDAIFAAETFVGQYFLVGPVRVRGIRRANYDLAGGVFKRLGQIRSQAVRGRKLFAITEHFPHALRDRAHCRGFSHEIFRYLESLKRLVQPGSPFFVFVAVADESAILIFRSHGFARSQEDLVA